MTEIPLESLEFSEPINPLHKVFEQIAANGVFAVALLQEGRAIDLMREDAQLARGRRFAVLEVAAPDPTIETAVYKTFVGGELSIAAANEVYFMREGFPLVRRGLSDDASSRVAFPDVLVSEPHAMMRQLPFVLQTKLEGSTLGTINTPEITRITPADVALIAQVIRACRDIDLAELRVMMPGLQLEGSGITQSQQRHMEVSHAFELGFREKWVKPVLGEEYWAQLAPVLRESERLLKDRPAIFAAGDINASNIIKMPDDTLGFIDWERIKITNSPALDYGFLFATLKDSPELQRAFFDEALALNQDIPDFRELMRHEFILNRGTGELGGCIEKAGRSTDLAEREQCLNNAAEYAELVKEAIDKRGIWAD